MGACSQAVAFQPQIQGTTDFIWELVTSRGQPRIYQRECHHAESTLTTHQYGYDLFPLGKFGRGRGAFVYIEFQALEEVREIGKVYFWKQV